MSRLYSRLSRWERLLLALLAGYLFLWPLEPLSGAVYGIRVALQVALYVIGAIVLTRVLYRLVRVLTRRFLWRVRHRMAAVFIFVGVIPLLLAVLSAAAGLALVFGPLAAYMTSNEIDKRAEALYATADSLAWELRAGSSAQAREVGARFLADARQRYPGILVRFETPDGPISFPEGFKMEDPPASLESYRGVVRLKGELYLAAYAEYQRGSPSLLLMIPLTRDYLLDFMPGLGVVEPEAGFTGFTRNVPPNVPPAAPAGTSSSSPSSAAPAAGGGNPLVAQAADMPEIRPSRGEQDRPLQMRLPSPAHPFDWPVVWRAYTTVLDWQTGEIRQEAVLRLITRSSAVLREAFKNQSDEMGQIARTLAYVLIGVLSVTLLISTVVAVSLTRTITGAINDLYVGARHVEKGDFAHRVPAKGYTQLTELARTFNSMTDSIGKLIVDQRERQRLESELAIANEVQAQLFPREAPHLDNFEVLGVCRPARLVSGDFYDYVLLSDGRVAICFGDVSGKGISAALVMAAVHSTVRTQLGRLLNADPQEAVAAIVSETNRQLFAGTAANKFATLFFGVYDPATGSLAYANAGHLPPLVVRSDGGEQPTLTELEVTGMVVGAFCVGAVRGARGAARVRRRSDGVHRRRDRARESVSAGIRRAAAGGSVVQGIGPADRRDHLPRDAGCRSLDGQSGAARRYDDAAGETLGMRAGRKLALIAGLLTTVLLMGTVGYRFIESWTWFDSFFMSLISLTTVGYGEIHPLSTDGRLFTSVLLMVGVTVVFAAIGIMSDIVLQLELGNYFEKRKNTRMLDKVSDHYIVCGSGRVGRGVIRELTRSGAKVVLIDNNEERGHWAEEQGIPVLVADASHDDTLLQAGIKRAKGLVAAIGSDAANVYVVLSARVLNPDLRIAARASDEQAEEKLRRAGAATVFTPYGFIGHRLAQALLRPHVLSFLDVASAFREGSALDLDIEQVRVADKSTVAGRTLEESRLRQKYGVIVLAIMRQSGAMEFNPPGGATIHAGDVLIAMGERSKLHKLEHEVEE